MADTQKNIDIIVDARDNNTIQTLTKRLVNLVNTTKNLTSGIKRTTDEFKFFNETLRMSNKAGVASLFKDLNKDTIKFSDRLRNLTGPLLSLLFFGMMLQQVFTGALKSLFEGYKKAIPEASAFNVLTNKLSANWEYFKFQLADALANSSLFQSFIGFVINILQWLQKLSPETKAWLGILLAVGAAFGGVLFIVGQVGLGLQGLATFSEILSAKVSKFTWGSMAKFGWMALATLAILGMKEALDVFYNSSELGTKAQKNLKKAFLDTINTAFKPLNQILNDLDIQINTMNEFWIIAGVTIHNFMLITLSLLDVLIFFSRTLINIVSLAIEPFITAMETAFKVIKSIINGDWSGGLKAATSYFSTLKKNALTDIGDIGDAFNNLVDDTSFKFQSLEGYAPALEEYRAELATSGTNTTNNYNIITTAEAVSQGIITDDTATQLRSLGVTLI